MHDPPHPGKVLKVLYLEPLELSIKTAAKALGICPSVLSAIVNGRASVTADIAVRFEKAFGRGASSWLKSQQKYDLWHVRQRLDLSEVQVLYRPSVEKIEAA